MPLEIERKFLVKNNAWRKASVSSVKYCQGYICIKNGIFRIRIAGDKGFITLKSFKRGFSRLEYEYSIPKKEAQELLRTFCEKPFIEKTRYEIVHNAKLWEVDEFRGKNKGLIVAEIELKSENETFSIPDWIGEEVSNDHSYDNSNLVKNPYKNWK